ALPSRSVLEPVSTPARLDFRSPEEIAGKNVDVRSGIFSLGGLLYLMAAGPEKYASFRARLMENQAGNPLAHDEELSHRISMVVRDAVQHDPKKRIATFVELIDLIDRARIAREPPRNEPALVHPPALEAAEPQENPPTEESEKTQVPETATTPTLRPAQG